MVLDVLSEYSDGLTSCLLPCSPVGHLPGYRERSAGGWGWGGQHINLLRALDSLELHEQSHNSSLNLKCRT